MNLWLTDLNLWEDVDVDKIESGIEVVRLAGEYRRYVQMARDARKFGDVLPMCRFAARAGVALRRMRGVAGVHNRTDA